MTTATQSSATRWLALAGFILLSFGGGQLIGVLTLPGDWYAALEKPAFNPPGWLFGPVWSVLYILIGIAGWRVWERGETRLQQLWWAQLGVNFLWSPAFFAAQQIGLALGIIVVMLALILAFIANAWPRDRTSALMFLPYAAWVGFATALNASIFWLN